MLILKKQGYNYIYIYVYVKKCFDVCFKNAHGKSTEFRSKAEADYSFILPEEKNILIVYSVYIVYTVYMYIQ